MQKAGDSSYTINEDRNEAAVMHWSRDKSIGQKFTLPTASQALVIGANKISSFMTLREFLEH